jgi:Ulp1 family protease
MGQLDHCLLRKTLINRSFSTAFANLYTDHFAITVRIGNQETRLKEPHPGNQNVEIEKELDSDIEEQKAKECADVQKESKNKYKNEHMVTKYQGFSLTRHDLNTLYKNQWINNNIANMFFVILRKQFPMIHAFTTFFYEALKKQNYNQAKKFTNRINIFDKDKIIIPINEPNRWVMVVVDFSTDKVYNINLHDPLE